MLEVNNSILNSAVAALESGKQPAFVEFVDKVVDYCVKNENGKVFPDWGHLFTLLFTLRN